MLVSALGFEGSRAALAARGVRLPADLGEGCGELGEREREGQHGEAPLGVTSARVERRWRLWGGGGWLSLGGWGVFGGG